MRVIVVGLGVQGDKRRRLAVDDLVALVDPIHLEATHKSVDEVPLDDFDAALLCVPDEPKLHLMEYLLSNRKHVLVEKPLFSNQSGDLLRMKNLADSQGVTCYTAYNHRFEPHFSGMKELLVSGSLGEIYSVRMFYGNGTARLVRESQWRDKGAGVLPDLGSHLLDTLNFWFGEFFEGFKIYSASRFENNSFDHVSFGSNGTPLIQLEASLLSWRNHFYADVYGEKGSAHINSLCKWGPSTLTIRKRKLPSGRPDEVATTLCEEDPTWRLEYEHFKRLCSIGESNLEVDLWINDTLQRLIESIPNPVKENRC